MSRFGFWKWTIPGQIGVRRNKYITTNLWILLPDFQGLKRPKNSPPYRRTPLARQCFFIVTLSKAPRVQIPFLLPASLPSNSTCPAHLVRMHLSTSLPPRCFPPSRLPRLPYQAPAIQHKLPVSLRVLRRSLHPFIAVLSSTCLAK